MYKFKKMNQNRGIHDEHFQGNHSIVYNPSCSTKAYFNPQIVNYELIKRSLLKNLQPRNKIHVNPNFRGNLNTNFNSNQLINAALKSQNTLLCNQGTSVVEIDKNKDELPKNDLTSTHTISHQSRFKKINLNNQKISNKYSWCVNKTDKDCQPLLKESNTIKPLEKKLYNYNSNKYKYTSPKKIINQTRNSKKCVLYKSATKIINAPEMCVPSVSKICNKEKRNLTPYKKHLSKYVYNKNKKLSVLNVAKAVRSKYKYLSNSEYKKSKYKIDKRNKLSPIGKKKSHLIEIKDLKKLFPNHLYKLKISPYKIYNIQTLSRKNYLWRRSETTTKLNEKMINQFPNRRVVNIGGILYKSTTNKLTLAHKKVGDSKRKTVTTNSKAKKIHVLYVRGEKFILENNGKALRRQSQDTVSKKAPLLTPKRIDIGGVTYLRKSQNVLIRTNVHEARHLVKKAKNKSIALLANLYKRSSMPCMIYHKFGKCTRHSKGLCMYKHDPKNISLCKKFLQGNCNNNNCLLSHQVTQEKMATCHFFLKGLCFRDNCPFLHVKLNKNAGICKNFLQGFCNLGKECSKRHLNMCPNFDKYGTCSLGSKCLYPHKKLEDMEKTFKTKEVNKINENSFQPNNQNESIQYYSHSEIPEKLKKTKKSLTKFKKLNSTKVKRKASVQKSLCLTNSDQINDDEKCLPKRIKLDKLPCYIPLSSDS